jgi:hypothetical protein
LLTLIEYAVTLISTANELGGRQTAMYLIVFFNRKTQTSKGRNLVLGPSFSMDSKRTTAEIDQHFEEISKSGLHRWFCSEELILGWAALLSLQSLTKELSPAV